MWVHVPPFWQEEDAYVMVAGQCDDERLTDPGKAIAGVGLSTPRARHWFQRLAASIIAEERRPSKGFPDRLLPCTRFSRDRLSGMPGDEIRTLLAHAQDEEKQKEGRIRSKVLVLCARDMPHVTVVTSGRAMRELVPNQDQQGEANGRRGSGAK